MKRRIWLAAAAVCLCMAGCSSQKSNQGQEEAKTEAKAAGQEEIVVQDGASDNKLGISWWGTQVVHEFTLEVCDKYTEETGIELEPVYASWGDYWQKMNTLSAAGDLPDIMRQDYSVIMQYASKGLLEPLDGYIESGKLDKTRQLWIV